MEDQDLNAALVFIDQLRKEIPKISFPFGRKVMLMTDPEIPPRRIAAFFKTQLDTFVREFEAEEKAAKEAQDATGS